MKQIIMRFVHTLRPFLLLGVAVVLILIGIVIFSSILLIAALFALIVFVFAYIRHRYYQHKVSQSYHQQTVRSQGRIVEHDPHESEK